MYQKLHFVLRFYWTQHRMLLRAQKQQAPFHYYDRTFSTFKPLVGSKYAQVYKLIDVHDNCVAPPVEIF